MTSTAGATSSEKERVLAPDCASVRRTVKELLPAALGVPEMTPLVLSDNPAGSAPAAITQL